MKMNSLQIFEKISQSNILSFIHTQICLYFNNFNFSIFCIFSYKYNQNSMKLSTSLKKLAHRPVIPQLPLRKMQETLYQGRTIDPNMEHPKMRLQKFHRRQVSMNNLSTERSLNNSNRQAFTKQKTSEKKKTIHPKPVITTFDHLKLGRNTNVSLSNFESKNTEREKSQRNYIQQQNNQKLQNDDPDEAKQKDENQQKNNLSEKNEEKEGSGDQKLDKQQQDQKQQIQNKAQNFQKEDKAQNQNQQKEVKAQNQNQQKDDKDNEEKEDAQQKVEGDSKQGPSRLGGYQQGGIQQDGYQPGTQANETYFKNTEKGPKYKNFAKQHDVNENIEIKQNYMPLKQQEIRMQKKFIENRIKQLRESRQQQEMINKLMQFNKQKSRMIQNSMRKIQQKRIKTIRTNRQFDFNFRTKPNNIIQQVSQQNTLKQKSFSLPLIKNNRVIDASQTKPFINVNKYQNNENSPIEDVEKLKMQYSSLLKINSTNQTHNTQMIGKNRLKGTLSFNNKHYNPEQQRINLQRDEQFQFLKRVQDTLRKKGIKFQINNLKKGLIYQQQIKQLTDFPETLLISNPTFKKSGI